MSRHTRGLVPINGEMRDSSFHSNPILLSSSTLGIIYSLVARGGVILAHHACCHGNFTEVAQQVLRNITRETDTRLSYASGEYMYHYMSWEGVVYLCITDDEFERSKAFLFLDDIKNKFAESYTGTIQSALPFAMNSEFSDVLKESMSHYSNASISMLPSQKLDNIKVRNLELLSDGQLEQLELLQSSDSFGGERSYESILDPQLRARCYDWVRDHWKLILVAVVAALFVLVVMVAIVLGVCLEDERSTCSRR